MADHVAELPRGVDVQQRERRPGGVEGLQREVQQDRGVLADRIQQHRAGGLAGDLAEDANALGLERAKMRGKGGHRGGVSRGGTRWAGRWGAGAWGAGRGAHGEGLGGGAQEGRVAGPRGVEHRGGAQGGGARGWGPGEAPGGAHGGPWWWGASRLGTGGKSSPIPLREGGWGRVRCPATLGPLPGPNPSPRGGEAKSDYFMDVVVSESCATPSRGIMPRKRDSIDQLRSRRCFAAPAQNSPAAPQGIAKISLMR